MAKLKSYFASANCIGRVTGVGDTPFGKPQVSIRCGSAFANIVVQDKAMTTDKLLKGVGASVRARAIVQSSKCGKFLNYVTFGNDDGSSRIKSYDGDDFKIGIIGQGKVVKQDEETLTISITKKNDYPKFLISHFELIDLPQENLVGTEVSFKGNVQTANGESEYDEYGEFIGTRPQFYLKEIKIEYAGSNTAGGGEDTTDLPF